MKNKSKNILLLLSTILVIILIDRLLLLYFGLPLWEWDEKLHYKHRPNVTKYWRGKNNKPIIINEYGFHDHSFPKKKKKKELRILNLGDSITMGHGVTSDETYSTFMEAILKDTLKNYSEVEAINAGVQGYSPFQELELLKRSLVFEPDVVTIGFCLNDVTEPFVVNSDLGGIGLDYHKVTQAPNKYLSFLLNETGFGRLIQEIRTKTLDAKQEKINEIFDVRKMLLNRDDEKYQKQWQFTLNELSKIFSLCNRDNIKVVLLIFPFTFQINDTQLSWTQDLLKKNAEQNNVPCVDFLSIFNEVFSHDPSVLNRYFLDEDHFTPEGHQFVAKEISKVITELINEAKQRND